MVFYASFNSISVISKRKLTSFLSFLSYIITKQGLWSVLPRDTPKKNPEDQVLLELRTPGLRVKYYHWAMKDPPLFDTKQPVLDWITYYP